MVLPTLVVVQREHSRNLKLISSVSLVCVWQNVAADMKCWSRVVGVQAPWARHRRCIPPCLLSVIDASSRQSR